MEQIYTGSKDGFTAKSFHEKCDEKGRLLILLRSKDYNKIFGAYTGIPWTSILGWKDGNGSSFLISYREDKTFIQLKCLDKEYEVYHSEKEIIQFGIFGNLYICNDCNITKNSCSYLGCNNSYEVPNGLLPNSNEANKYLAGEQSFFIDEIEVYRLI